MAFSGAIERFLPRAGSFTSPAGRDMKALAGMEVRLKQKGGGIRVGTLGEPSAASGWGSGTVTLHNVELIINGQKGLATKCNFHIDDILHIDGPAVGTAPADALSCWGCYAIQGAREFQICGRCKDAKLVAAARFCSKECLTANWPRHKAWHSEQEAMQKRATSDDQTPAAPFCSEICMPPQAFQKYTKLMQEAHDHVDASDYAKAQKKLRKAIELAPTDPSAFTVMGLCYRRSNDRARAAEWYLKAVALARPGSHDWAWAVSSAFNELMQDAQLEGPKPAWWDDATLLPMSERVVEVRNRPSELRASPQQICRC
jgi:hypothetical protein